MPNGGLLVASQLGKNVYRVTVGGGAPWIFADSIEVPAAIGDDSERDRLMLPQIRAASLTV